jgi:antitoxin ChpS
MSLILLFFAFAIVEELRWNLFKRGIMITANIRKQGKAAVMTIPGDILKKVNISIGAVVEISPADNGFFVRMTPKKARKRYSVQELMQGVTKDWANEIKNETSWARNGGPAGRELA